VQPDGTWSSNLHPKKSFMIQAEQHRKLILLMAQKMSVR
jgi:hypothetical protein